MGRAKSWEIYRAECEAVAAPGVTVIGFVEPWKGARTKLVCNCPDHGDWSSSNIDLFKRGRGCPSCVVDSKKTGIDRYLQRVKAIKIPGLSVLGIVEQGKYVGDKTKLVIECQTHGKYSSTNIHHWLSGRGCPQCANKNQQQAYISIIGESFSWDNIKFGISKDSVRRLGDQSSKAKGLQLRSEAIYTFPTVEACKSAERAVKQRYKAYLGSVPRHLLPDGFTETLPIIYIGAVTRVYEEFGGVRMKPKLKKSIKKQMNY